jgi:hypothetical protein
VESNGATTAILVGVWATFALDVFSTLNSSPQTTELFAGDREDSLMHWVLIGTAVGVGGGAIASYMSGKPWPLIATVAVSTGMYVTYKHAVKRGKAKPAPEAASGYSGGY